MPMRTANRRLTPAHPCQPTIISHGIDQLVSAINADPQGQANAKIALVWLNMVAQDSTINRAGIVERVLDIFANMADGQPIETVR